MHASKVEDNKNCEGPRQYLYLLTPFRFLHDCVLKSSLLFCYRSKKKISLNVRSNVNINLQEYIPSHLEIKFFLIHLRSKKKLCISDENKQSNHALFKPSHQKVHKYATASVSLSYVFSLFNMY